MFLFFLKIDKQFLIFTSRFMRNDNYGSGFFLNRILNRSLIEILYFANLFVVDKTPGLSLTSNLRYKEFE